MFQKIKHFFHARSFQHFSAGTTLIEILVAAAILGLVMTSIVAIITLSVKDAAEAKERAVAVKYAQEGMEFFLREKNNEGWETFVQTLQAHGAGTGGGVLSYCLPTVPQDTPTFQSLAGGACSTSDTSQYVDSRGIFQRQANITLTQNGSLVDVNVTVIVSWYEGNALKQSTISEKYEDYLSWEVEPATVYQPAPTTWKYRLPFAISNTGATLTNYQVMVTLNTATLISAGQLQSSCADLRMRASDGITDYAYWIEPTTCNTATTKIWVKVSSIPVNGTTIYAYYGNINANAPGYLTTNVFIREIPNVVAGYAMNEAAWNGTTGEVLDSSGSNNNGTAVGGATTVAGLFGNAGSFNGTSRYVSVPSATSLQIPNFTTFAWIKPTALGGRLIDKTLAGSSNGYNMDTFGGKLRICTNPCLSSNASLTTGAWQQVAVTFDGTNYSFYINGALDHTAVNGTAINTTSVPLRIASDSNGQNLFNGLIDDARVYSRAVTAAEISDLYGSGGNHEGYLTTNYPGKELVRQFSGNASVGSSGGSQSLTNWSYRQSFPIADTLGPAQTNFQVMITLNTATLISAAKMQSSCADLRVTASDGTTELPYWIEPTTCNTATTKIWVNVASIPTTGTSVYLYYGNTSATTPGYATTNVFLADNSNVVAAWDLDENAWINNCSTGSVLDTAGNGYNGRSCPSGSGPVGGATGIFNKAGSFDGVNDYVFVPDQTVFHGATPGSVSFWFKATNLTQTLPRLIEEDQDANNAWSITINDAAEGTPNSIEFTGKISGIVGAFATPKNSITAGSWYNVVVTSNGAGSVSIYLNGVLQTIAAASAENLGSTAGLSFARRGDNQRFFNGLLDNIRLYNKQLVSTDVSTLYGASGGSRQGYVTTNYTGRELVRLFNPNVTVGASGGETAGSWTGL